MRHRLRKLFLLPCMLLVVASSLFSALPASALTVTGGGGSSGNSGLSQIQSLLNYVETKCTGIILPSQNNIDSNCNTDQSVLAAVAVCPTPLFTTQSSTITAGRGGGGTIEKYSLNSDNISTCKTNVANTFGIYQTSQTLLNSFLKDCVNMTGKNDQWNTCQNNYQNMLNSALGCHLFMVDTLSGGGRFEDWNAVDKNGECAGIISGILGQAALQDCQSQGFAGSDLTACQQGYEGQAQGNTNACSGESGSGATACQQGMDDSSSATTNDGGLANQQQNSSLSCDSQGDPMNWVLCPIFDAVSGFSDWLFQSVVQPLLIVTPLSTSPNSPSYHSWSDMRNIADVILIISLLVIVFGQSIGGGLVDAYTAKKVLPRLLVAAILINLSLYIVAALIDITNVLGAGIGTLIVSTIGNNGAFHITPSGVQAGAILGVTAAAGTFALVIFKFIGSGGLLTKSLLSKAISLVALFVIMPVFFGLLAAFTTLVLRQAIILALVIVSPVAFALYCLPNTEQYFRRWWNFLVQTLMVYPIVILFFAVSDVLSYTLYQTGHNNNAAYGPLAALISFVLQFLPLILIPFAFRLAGGALGKVHEALTTNHRRVQEGIKGNPNDPNSLRNRTKRNVSAEFTRARAQRFREWNKSTNPIARRTAGLGAYLTGGAIESEAMLTQAAKQRVSAVRDNGDDAIINARASWVDSNGDRWTLDGKPVSAMEWAAAQRQYPTIAEMQAVAEYRAGKITDVKQGEDFLRNYATMTQQQGISPEEANGILKGFAFGKQNEFGHMKYGSIEVDENTGERRYRAVGTDVTNPEGAAADFVQENYSNRNSYAAGAQHAEFHQAMGDVKKGHLAALEGWEQRGGGEFIGNEKHHYDELKKITEMERNFEYGGSMADPEHEGQVISTGRGQLTGASAQTQAAFNDLKAAGREVSTGRNGPVYTTTSTALQRIEGELNSGQTIYSERHGSRELGDRGYDEPSP